MTLPNFQGKKIKLFFIHFIWNCQKLVVSLQCQIKNKIIMEAKLGQFVKTGTHGHQGRIIKKHHSFFDTGENMTWFKGQRVPIREEAKREPWYSILCKDGGSVVVPEYDIVSIEEPYELNNIWEDFYF